MLIFFLFSKSDGGCCIVCVCIKATDNVIWSHDIYLYVIVLAIYLVKFFAGRVLLLITGV